MCWVVDVGSRPSEISMSHDCLDDESGLVLADRFFAIPVQTDRSGEPVLSSADHAECRRTIADRLRPIPAWRFEPSCCCRFDGPFCRMRLAQPQAQYDEWDSYEKVDPRRNIGRLSSLVELVDRINWAARYMPNCSKSDDTKCGGYGSVIAFRSRQQMMQAAASAYFSDYPNPDLQSQFDDLMRDAAHFSGRRNDIAHGIVQPYYGSDADPAKEDATFALVPSLHATSKHKMTKIGTVPNLEIMAPTYIYSGAQIINFGIHFSSLGRRE